MPSYINTGHLVSGTGVNWKRFFYSLLLEEAGIEILDT
jgi:hypothetical protein